MKIAPSTNVAASQRTGERRSPRSARVTAWWMVKLEAISASVKTNVRGDVELVALRRPRRRVVGLQHEPRREEAAEEHRLGREPDDDADRERRGAVRPCAPGCGHWIQRVPDRVHVPRF